MKLFIDPEEMKQDYESSPIWLKDLMNAFADGINYYLYTHPETQPKLLTRFEPWMALTFSEGSIGGDIERVNLSRLKNFYGEDKTDLVIAEPFIRDDEPRGSNGISIAPQKTKNGNALFLINPHTSFFFRSEVHMISQEGLNAYGAVTWGQFFIYQGFNERVGWMHTSSRADAIDEYLETIFEKDDTYYYLVGEDERELESKVLSIPYKTDAGNEVMDFTVYYSHHGPIIREQDGKHLRFQFSLVFSNQVIICIILLKNCFKVFIDCISSGRSMHPSYPFIETLVYEKLAPSNSAIGI